MLKENTELKVEKQQNSFYVDVVERPNKWGITEDLIHQHLGNIHQNKPQRLTDEEKEIIRRWNEWNLKDIPEDWQTKFQNFIQISNKLSEWNKYFGDAKPLDVKTEYDKPREKHEPADLKPIGLPDNWKTELDRIPSLEKRPTQEELKNAVKQATEKYKDYDQIKADFNKLKNELNQFLNNYGVNTLIGLGQYINNLKTNPILSKEKQEAIDNYDKIKTVLEEWQTTFKNQKPKEVKTDLDDKTKLFTSWHNIFGDKEPYQIEAEIEALKNKPTHELTDKEKEAIANYDKWKETFKDFKKEPQEIKKDYDDLKTRLTNAINNLTKEQQKNKDLKNENKKLTEQLGSPMDRFVENKLKEVIIADDYEKPYLVKTLENILTWRDGSDKERRKAVFKYYEAIKKNIAYLKGRLTDTQKQVLNYSNQL